MYIFSWTNNKPFSRTIYTSTVLCLCTIQLPQSKVNYSRSFSQLRIKNTVLFVFHVIWREIPHRHGTWIITYVQKNFSHLLTDTMAFCFMCFILHFNTPNSNVNFKKTSACSTYVQINNVQKNLSISNVQKHFWCWGFFERSTMFKKKVQKCSKKLQHQSPSNGHYSFLFYVLHTPF